MDPLSLLPLAFSLLLAMFIAWSLLQPFVVAEELSSAETKPEEDLHLAVETRERAYQALEDLEADYLGGKIDRETYTSLKEELSADAYRG